MSLRQRERPTLPDSLATYEEAMRVAACLALAALLVAKGSPAEIRVEELVAQNRYVLEFEGTKLSGPGWEFLLTATTEAQFIGLAEPHNAREVPLFASALLNQLHQDRGFDYLVLEQGPHIVELLAQAARQADPNRLLETARRYPEAIHFRTDQELAMLADAVRLPDAPVQRVWGIDRAIATRHILEHLRGRAPTDEARRLVERGLEQAVEMLSENDDGEVDDHLIESETDIFDRIEATFRPAPESEEAFLLAVLQHGHRSHRTFLEASEENGLGYVHNREREEWMKSTFLRHYRAAQAAGDQLPKAILKLGHVHMQRGRNRLRVLTLGNFLTEFARSNGKESFILNLAPINQPGDYWSLSDYPAYKEIADAGEVDRWILVDVRPLRGHVHSGAIRLSPELEHAVFGSDAFLLMGGASRGTVSWR